MIYVIIALIALFFLIIISNIVVVQQSRAYVIERLGAFQSVWGVGLHFKIPFIDRIARRVSMKEQVLDYPPQPVITKDMLPCRSIRWFTSRSLTPSCTPTVWSSLWPLWRL